MDEAEFNPVDFPPPPRMAPAKLYLISPQEVGGGFPDRLRAAVGPGLAAAFQLRVKNRSEDELARLAEPLQRICADANVAFIVNDSIALAKRLGADGVHLGQSDGDIREARALLGPGAQIGKTCHDSRHLAMEAGEAGADYQVLYFKYSGGKRIFRMAPLHHHYELEGWKESQVVVRFWIITMMLVLFGLSTLKLR